MGSPPPSTPDPSRSGRREGPADGGDGNSAPRRLVVRGTSMRPALADGDVLTLAPAPATGDVGPGEIVTYRDADGRLVTHRVLGRETSGEGPMMVTQGDGRTEPDAAWPADRLVGSVTAAAGPPRRLMRRLVACERLAWWELAERSATLARSWRAVRAIQRRLLRGDMPIREERRAPASGGWLAITCTAVDHRGRAAGWQTTVRQGSDAATGRPLWLLFGLQVRLRYRGLGLAARLVAAGEAAIAREGGGLLYAFVHPDNRPSAELFRGSGWREAPAPVGTVRAPELASCLCFVKTV